MLLKQVKFSDVGFFTCLLIVLFVIVGCTRYQHFIGTSINNGKAVLSFYVGYHLVANSGKNDNEFIEALLEQELQKVQLCPDGHVIDRKECSRHMDYLWFFHCNDHKQAK